jgi:hypothetical protein
MISWPALTTPYPTWRLNEFTKAVRNMGGWGTSEPPRQVKNLFLFYFFINKKK